MYRDRNPCNTVAIAIFNDIDLDERVLPNYVLSMRRCCLYTALAVALTVHYGDV